MWDDSAPTRRAIDELGFLRQLGDGTLPLPAFRRYIEQDFLYLTEYSKALALVSTKASDPEAAVFWAKSAVECLSVEAALHGQLLEELPGGGAPLEHSQACRAYVSYLVATAATAPYSVAAAAVLPCFWIYADVGSRLAVSAAEVLARDPGHPYARWVQQYGDPEFASEVERAKEFVDAAAESASPAERDAAVAAFRTAARYELMFWDSAANPQPWPA
jgi:thiaminase/transcriptional activator TenA